MKLQAMHVPLLKPVQAQRTPYQAAVSLQAPVSFSADLKTRRPALVFSAVLLGVLGAGSLLAERVSDFFTKVSVQTSRYGGHYMSVNEVKSWSRDTFKDLTTHLQSRQTERQQLTRDLQHATRPEKQEQVKLLLAEVENNKDAELAGHIGHLAGKIAHSLSYIPYGHHNQVGSVMDKHFARISDYIDSRSPAELENWRKIVSKAGSIHDLSPVFQEFGPLLKDSPTDQAVYEHHLDSALRTFGWW